MERIIEFLEKVPMTIVSGVFLVLSFALPRFGIVLPIDLAWVSVIVSGLPLLYSAVRKLIKNRGISKISSALLISVAMIAAIAIGDLFAAGEVAFIMALGEILEELTTDRAKKGLHKLISLAPTQGRRISEGGEETVAAEEIRRGDILRILPGETIPVDGVIVSGETSVDQSVMTGESMPVDKTVGDEVYCGTVNRFGAIDIRATGVGEDSSLQRLIRMVREAEGKKAPMARVADKAASWLVPAALLVAIVTLIVTRDIRRAVTVLVVFCPCALVLATPTAIMAAIGQATKRGVVIKSGEALEKMGKVDVIAFDKTGTLTHGRLAVSDIISFDENTSEDKLLSFAASAEAKSEHPLGRAIVTFARERETEILESESFKMNVGRGVCAEIDRESVICGSESYLAEMGVELRDDSKKTLLALREQGKASVLVARGGVCIGVLALSDVIRPEASEVVSRLGKMRTETVLLTGDNRLTAEYFASMAGIGRVMSELLPEDKVSGIEALRAEGHTVCMIGDGVNDAPALEIADVGVAMGSMGSDIAVEAADIALMNDDISTIPYLKRLSVATLKTIKFSITLSMLINILAVVLSVAGLLNPTTGALVHNAGSCFVVLIAALLYDRKFK
ncbi:MAG: cation-translocating P-type ATPase [Clostridia bacterium]|nr:cation-translocating P-type ATPase [Clostridia bacterium]